MKSFLPVSDSFSTTCSLLFRHALLVSALLFYLFDFFPWQIPELRAEDAPHFTNSPCEKLLSEDTPACHTMREIMAATKTASCGDFKRTEDNKFFQVRNFDLVNKQISDLSPFCLFHFSDGSIDLSNNAIEDPTPLGAQGWYRINLSNNKLHDAKLLRRVFGVKSLILDGNSIDDPRELGTLALTRDFSLRHNHSSLGEDFDKGLDRLFEFYGALHRDWELTKTEATFDRERVLPLLAERMSRFISLKDVTPEEVLSNINKYYTYKTDIDFIPAISTLKISRSNGILRASHVLQYHWYDNSLLDEAEEYPMQHRSKDVWCDVEIEFTDDMRISSYVEKNYRRPVFKVLRATQATASVQSVWDCLATACRKLTGKTEVVPAGTELQGNFENASNSLGGKSGVGDAFDYVLYHGRPLWVRSSMSISDTSRTDDSKTFLEVVKAAPCFKVDYGADSYNCLLRRK